MTAKPAPGHLSPVAVPRFSVVVPAYQAEATLAETVDAIVAQTFQDWECVIVDDGSADATREIANRYAAQDPRIRVLHQINSGTAGAYNKGVSSAIGQFIVLCSADDILLADHLKTFSAFIDANPDYDIFSSNGHYWRPGEGRDLVYRDAKSRVEHSWTLADVIRRCFYSVGAAYRRELFDRAGGYREEMFGEDYDFWLRAMAIGASHRYIPQPLSLFRVSPTQKSARLETAYLSDIRLVSELQATHDLTPDERRAVLWAIRERIRLIDELHNTALKEVRLRLEQTAVSVFGWRVARRSWHAIRAIARTLVRLSPRSNNAR
jgi:glycosyltransferase involved in cell wall biosynthesis